MRTVETAPHARAGGERCYSAVFETFVRSIDRAFVSFDPEEKVVDKKTLIDKLNEDLSNELSAIVQYITYAAKVTGPYRPQLVQFFLAEVPDEQGHAQYLANKIVALGGEPTTEPASVPPAKNNREMLHAILEAERAAIRGYSERAEQAEQFGDKGLQVQLEDMVRDESGHAEETERILRDWPV